MKKISRVILILILLLLGFGLFCKKSVELLRLGKKIQIIKLIQGKEEEKSLIGLINRERAIRGLGELSGESSLEEIAERRVKEILEEENWSHKNNKREGVGDKAREMGYIYKIIGENLAKNYESEEEVLKAWLESEKHRENLLRREYSKAGLGEGERDGVKIKVLVLAD